MSLIVSLKAQCSGEDTNVGLVGTSSIADINLARSDGIRFILFIDDVHELHTLGVIHHH